MMFRLIKISMLLSDNFGKIVLVRLSNLKEKIEMILSDLSYCENAYISGVLGSSNTTVNIKSKKVVKAENVIMKKTSKHITSSNAIRSLNVVQSNEPGLSTIMISSTNQFHYNFCLA